MKIIEESFDLASSTLFLVEYFRFYDADFIKEIFYVIVLTWLYSIFFMIYHVLPSLLTAYYAYDDSSIIFFLNLYLVNFLSIKTLVLSIIDVQRKASEKLKKP